MLGSVEYTTASKFGSLYLSLSLRIGTRSYHFPLASALSEKKEFLNATLIRHVIPERSDLVTTWSASTRIRSTAASGAASVLVAAPAHQLTGENRVFFFRFPFAGTLSHEDGGFFCVLMLLKMNKLSRAPSHEPEKRVEACCRLATTQRSKTAY